MRGGSTHSRIGAPSTAVHDDEEFLDLLGEGSGDRGDADGEAGGGDHARRRRRIKMAAGTP